MKVKLCAFGAASLIFALGCAVPRQPASREDELRRLDERLDAAEISWAGAVDDPRGLVEQVLETNQHHRAPDHAPTRALRVLENAARVDAIITVSSGLMPIGTQSASEAQIASEALRPLAGVVRSARMAAVSAILESAWQR